MQHTCNVVNEKEIVYFYLIFLCILRKSHISSSGTSNLNFLPYVCKSIVKESFVLCKLHSHSPCTPKDTEKNKKRNCMRSILCSSIIFESCIRANERASIKHLLMYRNSHHPANWIHFPFQHGSGISAMGSVIKWTCHLSSITHEFKFHNKLI